MKRRTLGEFSGLFFKGGLEKSGEPGDTLTFAAIPTCVSPPPLAWSPVWPTVPTPAVAAVVSLPAVFVLAFDARWSSDVSSLQSVAQAWHPQRT